MIFGWFFGIFLPFSSTFGFYNGPGALIKKTLNCEAKDDNTIKTYDNQLKKNEKNIQKIFGRVAAADHNVKINLQNFQNLEINVTINK